MLLEKNYSGQFFVMRSFANTHTVVLFYFSITTINNIDYIQFCKKINDKRYQYKIKITSYNLQKELEKFIDSLNINYSLNLNK